MSFWSATKDMFAGRRPVGDVVGSAMHGYRTIRVAVMGSKSSGKTVFITALANHLRDHRPAEFPLGGRVVTWDKDAISGDMLHDLPLFDYEESRGLLSKGEWPSKTTASSILALRLLVEDKNGKQENVQLEIVDVPGERIADFAMKGRSYREWCRWMQKDSATLTFGAYLEAVKKMGPGNEAALLDAYRDYIAAEYANCVPCITPSTVKLGIDVGSKPIGGRPEAFRAAISSVPIGFVDEKGEVCQFIPLPVECFAKDSPWHDLAKKYERAYDRYVRKIVRPVVKWMAGAEKMFYLVDMLSLLQLGPKSCESERQYGEAAISALCPRRGNVFERIGKWASGFLWKTRVNTMYVVATKADCVWSQANRDNLVVLVDSLLGRSLKFIDKRQVKTDIISCAAVCSTKERTDGISGLQGKIPPPDNPGGPVQILKWKPSDVPSVLPSTSEEWKAKIDGGEFNYPFAFPWFDEARICPPKQLNLDVLAEAMLSK